MQDAINTLMLICASLLRWLLEFWRLMAFAALPLRFCGFTHAPLRCGRRAFSLRQSRRSRGLRSYWLFL